MAKEGPETKEQEKYEGIALNQGGGTAKRREQARLARIRTRKKNRAKK